MGSEIDIFKTDLDLQEPDAFVEVLCLYLNSLSASEKEELLGSLQFGRSLPKRKGKKSV
jgi:hypothetical protein